MLGMMKIANGYENCNSLSFWSRFWGFDLYLYQGRKLASVARA